MVLPILAVVVLALPPIAVVATPGGACPGADVIDAALAGVGAASRSGAAADAIWTLIVEDAARVVLRDPAGETALVRVFPAEPGRTCQAAARVVALMVERYFHDVAWTAGTPAPRARAPAPAREPGVPATSAPLTLSARPAPRALPPRLEVSAGPVLWTREPSPLAALEVRGRLASIVSIAVGAMVPPPRRSEALAAGGELRLDVWPLLLRVGAQIETGRVAWRLGLDGLLTSERAQAPDQLAEPASKHRWVLAAGVAAGAVLALAPRWRLVIEAGAYRAALGHSFVVRGGRAGEGEARVLEPPAWQGLVAARVAWVVAP